MDSSARITRSVRSSQRVDHARVQLADDAADREAAVANVDPRRAPARDGGRLVVERLVDGRGSAEAVAQQLDRRPSRRRGRSGRGRPVPGRRLGGPGQREPEAPPLAGAVAPSWP